MSDVYRIGFNTWQCRLCGCVVSSPGAGWHRAAKCQGFWKSAVYRLKRWLRRGEPNADPEEAQKP